MIDSHAREAIEALDGSDTITAPSTREVSRRGFLTEQVHAGELGDAAFGARVAPLHLTAGFEFDDVATARARFAGTDDGYSYTRIGNPTTDALARRLARLEGGVDAVVVGSGQAAVTVALLGLLQAGDHLLSAAPIYEGSRGLFLEDFARFGIDVDFVDDVADADAWRRGVRPNTRALFAESISNPTTVVLDTRVVAEVAHSQGVPLVVDNTLATPYLLRPLELGADVVVHSASKYLSGHGTALGGALVISATNHVDWAAQRDGRHLFPHLATATRAQGGRSWSEVHGGRAYLEFCRQVLVPRLGSVLAPFNAFLIAQGIQTLGLRMARHSESALTLAGWLSEQAPVHRVDYAGLATHPSHMLARRDLPRGAGGVFSLTLDGGSEAAERFIHGLRLFTHMTHLGDVRSLVVHPASTTHAHRTEAEQRRVGIEPGTVRLSIGIEDVEDLQDDLRAGLAAAEVSAARGVPDIGAYSITVPVPVARAPRTARSATSAQSA